MNRKWRYIMHTSVNDTLFGIVAKKFWPILLFFLLTEYFFLFCNFLNFIVTSSKKLSINLWKRIMRYYLWTVLKYSYETLTMNAESEKKLNSFEMWCYRRLLKIPWTDFSTSKNKRTKKYGRRYQKSKTEVYSTQNPRKWHIHAGSVRKNWR